MGFSLELMFDMKFDPILLKTMIGGASVLDMSHLRMQTRQQAKEFLLAYGYDIDNDSDSARLWSFHRRAVTYIETQLLTDGKKVPQDLAEAVLLKDLANLLLWASEAEPKERKQWACAILRVMHVLNHLSNDLFTAFSDEIQDQILHSYQDHIVNDENGRVTLGRVDEEERIQLEKFDIKPFKTSNSSITKLLAKPEEVAFGLMDKMGVRFVTRSVFDCFRVLRWLVRHNVVSYPHLIPDQSNNTLYPLNLFVEAIGEMESRKITAPDAIESYLQEKLAQTQDRASYREKLNVFTSRDYRFMKFIVRRLIRTRADSQGKPFMFYYPYEVQIMDLATFERNSIGPSSHAEYKARQRQRAYERVFRPEARS